MRLTITGAAGFVGHHLVNYFLSQGFEVQGIDSFTEYYSTDLKRYRINQIEKIHGHQNFKLIEEDLCSENLFTEVCSFRPDSIIHLAAQAGVRQGLSGSIAYSRNNIQGFLEVVKIVKSVQPRTFMFASSSSVYGRNATVPFSEQELNLRPTSIYGITKLANELLVEATLRGVDTRSRGLRFFTVYGPAGRPDMAYFQAISSSLIGTKFKKFGSGEIRRDFTYIADVCESIDKLENELRSRQSGFVDVVNVGGGKPVSINEMIRDVELITGNKIDLEQYQSSQDDLELTHCDTNHLFSLIGRKDFKTFRYGITETIKWFKTIDKQRVLNWVS